MNNFWRFVILIVISYFLGNINFARILSKARKDDITTHGSGNPGTMNMLRTHGITMGVVTLIFDALKSVIACLIGYFWLKAVSTAYVASLAVHVCGLACIIGHNYPVIFKFKGGKGVATGFGLVCVARPILIPVVLGVFLAVFLIKRVASISSLSGVLTFFVGESIFLLVKGYYASFVVLLISVALIFYAHKSNIKKIFEKNEKQIDLKDAVQKDKDHAKLQREKRAKKKEERQHKSTKNTEVESVEEGNLEELESTSVEENNDEISKVDTVEENSENA